MKRPAIMLLIFSLLSCASVMLQAGYTAETGPGNTLALVASILGASEETTGVASGNAAEAEAQAAAVEVKPFMGVSVESIPESLRQHLNLPEGFGVIIRNVEKDGPAAAAGMQKHDILLDVDGQQLIGARHLQVLIQARKPGETVAVRLLRAGQEAVASVVLSARPVSNKWESIITRVMPRGVPAPPPPPPVAPLAPVAPLRPHDELSESDLEAYELEMEAFERQMDAYEAEMERYEEQMEVFEEHMEEMEELGFDGFPSTIIIKRKDGEDITVDLSDVTHGLENLHETLSHLKQAEIGETISNIIRQYGDHGYRTSITRMEERDITYKEGDDYIKLRLRGPHMNLFASCDGKVFDQPISGIDDPDIPACARRMLKELLKDNNLDLKEYEAHNGHTTNHVVRPADDDFDEHAWDDHFGDEDKKDKQASEEGK